MNLCLSHFGRNKGPRKIFGPYTHSGMEKTS